MHGAVCRQFNGENLVKFYGSVSFTTDTETKVGLLFEWCNGGTLADVIQESTMPYPTYEPDAFPEVKRMVLEILGGVNFLHSKGMAHRDLKPENIMVRKNVRRLYVCVNECRLLVSPQLTARREVRVGDMGLEKKVDVETGTICGTSLYMAPEILLGYPDDMSVDMYSIGLIMWELWNSKRLQNIERLRGFDPANLEPIAKGTIRLNEEEYALPEQSTAGFTEVKTRKEAWEKTAKKSSSFDPKERVKVSEAYCAITDIK